MQVRQPGRETSALSVRIRLTKLHRAKEGAGRGSLPKQVYFWPSAAAVRSARRPKALGLAVTRDPGARHRWVSPRAWGPGARSSRGGTGELASRRDPAGAAVTPSTQHESFQMDPVPLSQPRRGSEAPRAFSSTLGPDSPGHS